MRPRPTAAPHRLAKSITIVTFVVALLVVGTAAAILQPSDGAVVDAATLEPAREATRGHARSLGALTAGALEDALDEVERTAAAVGDSVRWTPDDTAEPPPPSVGQDRPSELARALPVAYSPRTRVLHAAVADEPYVLLVGPEREAHLRDRAAHATPALRSALAASRLARAVHVRIDGFGVIGLPGVQGVDELPAAVLGAPAPALDPAPRWQVEGQDLVLTREVRDGTGTRVGLVAVEVDRSAFDQAFRSLAHRGVGGTTSLGDALLLDAAGLPVAWTSGAADRLDLSTDSRPDLSPLAFETLPRAVRTLPGDDTAAVAAVGDAGWRVVTWAPSDVVAGVESSVGALLATRSWTETSLQVVVAAVVALVVLLAGLWLARSLDRRLSRLVRGADAQIHGDLDATIQDDGQDELALLARLLNAGAVRRRHLVAQLEESERRHDQLVSHMADGFFVTDASDRIAELNQRFADFLQRSPDALEGTYIEELLLPESVERYRIESGRLAAHRPTQCELVWRGGVEDHRRTIMSSLPLYDATGRYAGAYHVLTDITQRERAHAETAKAQKIRALGEMADGIVHEFNNLLTVILGNVQYLCLEADLTDDDREALETVERAALDGTETIRRIREFTKVRTVNSSDALVDPGVVLQHVCESVKAELDETNPDHGIEIELLARSRRMTRGGEDELGEALAAIVANAVEAMPKGGRLILESFDRGEDTVALRVRDSGVGMSQEVIEKACDPFFSTKAVGRCSGLGLSIAFGIVRAHSGRLQVRSRPGKGTTVTCVLPAATDAAQVEEPPRTGDAPPTPRVLLVGPLQHREEALQCALQDLGLYVAMVSSAQTALALLMDAGIFNTLLVEYDLTDTTGWELARQARANRRDLRILLLADPSQGLDLSQSRNVGIDRILERPLDARDVHGAVMTALASPPRTPQDGRRDESVTVEIAQVWSPTAADVPTLSDAEAEPEPEAEPAGARSEPSNGDA